jgi:hypothetical protein
MSKGDSTTVAYFLRHHLFVAVIKWTQFYPSDSSLMQWSRLLKIYFVEVFTQYLCKLISKLLPSFGNNLNYGSYFDRLCGLMVRVPGYRSRGPGMIPGATRFSEKYWV